MKSFHLLILTLITGCKASPVESEVEGCRGGWVDFTCNYPNPSRSYEAVDFKLEKVIAKSTLKNQWDNDSRFSLHHNTTNKALRVIIRDLQDDDKAVYKCRFFRPNGGKKDKWRVKLTFGQLDKGVCQEPVDVTAYREAETTITCEYPGERSYVKFFCKESGPTCEDVSSNGMFTLTETDRKLTVSINEVSSQHRGVYWCGLKPDGESFQAGVRRITINDIPTSTFSPTVGEPFTHQCEYPNDAPLKKFICKGDHPSSCQQLISGIKGKTSRGRFSIKIAPQRLNLTFSVRAVAAEDSGTYWCGAERTVGTHRDLLYQKFRMVIGGAQLAVIIPAVCAAVLVLSLLLVLAFKRTRQSKHSTNGEAHTQKEERAYEEIQEHPQKPASGTALKTIYTTANFPTIPSAPHEYDSITFTNHSSDANNEVYSTVRDSEQCANPPAASHPSGPSEDPFYSTLDNPQQQQQQQQ
ncbi:polymeric immunoglobulin receptor-like [Halichoeres trimaculatus]|uniref:polymeric immunoglobulin receptor-like n=1 Tax=Halichoeres trimaculatus TaxID=147232 RepID=UPI003D9E45F0